MPTKNIDDIKSPENIERDYKSLEEEKNKYNGHTRKNLHYIFIIALWGAFTIISIVVLIRVWHLLTPWDWLDQQSISSIDRFLFSGVLGGVLVKFSNYALNIRKED
ncbi:MAG: hypothetical protein JW801_03810 [Bacteroidales bacterium]|nr:hypothetical protein [Bacteroidales bacterium]